MSDRFINTDWYCDRCGEYLNSQSNFDDHKYIWKCTDCGHKNSISSDNIYDSHEEYQNDVDDEEEGVLGSIFKGLFK